MGSHFYRSREAGPAEKLLSRESPGRGIRIGHRTLGQPVRFVFYDNRQDEQTWEMEIMGNGRGQILVGIKVQIQLVDLHMNLRLKFLATGSLHYGK